MHLHPDEVPSRKYLPFFEIDYDIIWRMGLTQINHVYDFAVKL